MRYAILALCAALFLAACGSDTESVSEPTPALPDALVLDSGTISPDDLRATIREYLDTNPMARRTFCANVSGEAHDAASYLAALIPTPQQGVQEPVAEHEAAAQRIAQEECEQYQPASRHFLRRLLRL